MFQFEPVQRAHSLLREIHCCCVAESTTPSTRTSLNQPPLAQPFFWLSRMLPRTCMRRNGAAWDTAHCIVLSPMPSVGVTAKFSAPRQKFCVALSWSRKALARRSPIT